MKQKTLFLCNECGYESPKWFGKCPSCGAWNTMSEFKPAAPSAARGTTSFVRGASRPTLLGDIETGDEARFLSGIGELDRVLGGGAVHGSFVLVGGEPGIGKSTLLLQLCGRISEQETILYVSGEESQRQLKMRAQRLGVDHGSIYVLAETDLNIVLSTIDDLQPTVLIVDSIQTMYDAETASTPGSISQVRECTMRIMRSAKDSGYTAFVVGHINKEGSIAGPKVLEHMVDCVLYFEGDKTLPYRVLRAVKNRYGSTNEIGMFDMTGKGLEQIENPSQVMLEGRPIGISGTCVACVMEGTRPVLSEIQALVTKTAFPSPRRTASGFDYNRMYLLLAVLEKRAGYVFGNQDVYINIIGGLKLDETACDLPVCLAMASSLLDLPVPEKTLAIGEVGLGGEVRSVPHLETRLREAQRVGFDTAIVPKHNLNMLDAAQFPGLRLVGVAYLREAINAIKINK